MGSFRYTSKDGFNCKWRIGRNLEGKWEIVSLSGIKHGKHEIPIAFAPFELSNAVVNSPIFDTEDEAVAFVRRL